MLEFPDKDIKTVAIALFHMVKKLNRVIGDMKKTQTELLKDEKYGRWQIHELGLMAD